MTPEQLEIRHEQNPERHEQNQEHHCRGHAALTIEQLELQHNPLNLTQDELNEFNDMIGRPCSKNPSIFELNAGVNVATTIIKTSEEIQCYYDASDNNKSAGDKRKQSCRYRSR